MQHILSFDNHAILSHKSPITLPCDSDITFFQLEPCSWHRTNTFHTKSFQTAAFTRRLSILILLSFISTLHSFNCAFNAIGILCFVMVESIFMPLFFNKHKVNQISKTWNCKETETPHIFSSLGKYYVTAMS